MEELLEKLVAWFRRRTGVGAGSLGSRDGRSGDRKRDRLGQNRVERFEALSPSTRWVAVAEAEYEVDSAGPGAKPPMKPDRQVLLESPVPDGAAPFGRSPRGAAGGAGDMATDVDGDAVSSGFGQPGSVEPADDVASPIAEGRQGLDPRHSDGRRGGDKGGEGRRDRRDGTGRDSDRTRPTWNELWEADGLLSHDGTYLRFQSWDGTHDVELLIGDMSAEVDDDELELTGTNFRFVIEDIEPVTPPAGIRPDLARSGATRTVDRFAGLLEQFPQLGITPT